MDYSNPIPILSALDTTVDPLGIDELLSRSGLDISRATARRRLDGLLTRGLIVREGKARATRYALTDSGRQAVLSERRGFEHPANILDTWMGDIRLREGEPEDGIDTAARMESERVRSLVRRPLGSRPRVGYQRAFLDAYEPNVTAYLPEKLRHRLRNLGQSDQMARMPAATYVRQVFDRLLIDLSWNSSRLEGNTFSLLETETLLELGQTADPARILEARMILNHKEAIEFLVEAPDEIGFNRYTLLNLHSLLARDLLRNPASEGRLRSLPVGIGGCAYLPLDIPQQIEEYFMEILTKASLIEDPLEQCFFVMVHLPYLQPFEDANKRVSRLAANIPLIRENLSPISFAGVSSRDYTDAILAVYELNRVDLLRDLFATAYEESAARYAAVRQSLGQPDPLALHYHEALRRVVQEIVQQSMDKSTAADHLRRWARDHVEPAHRPRVIELAETGLLCLHEGNIARYRLRPSEFTAWQATWQRRP